MAGRAGVAAVIEIIEWDGGNALRAICRVAGHAKVMSNPACYDCSRCGAIGRYHYRGHTTSCYTKYSNGKCFCEGNWAPFEWQDDVFVARQGRTLAKSVGVDIWEKRRNAEAICNILNRYHAGTGLTQTVVPQ